MTLLALVLAGVGVIFEVFAVVEYVSFYVFMGFAFVYYFYMKYSRVFVLVFLFIAFNISMGIATIPDRENTT